MPTHEKPPADCLDRRRAGVLLHLTSLPGDGPCGCLGADAYRFADFLADGGFTGTGLGRGNPNQVPEAQNDFIFASIGEELGLLGVVFVLALFLLLVTRIMVIGMMAHRKGRIFQGFVAYGIGLWIGLQALVNIGVNLGVLPTKGLTLPLISSGGSSMLMVLVAIGIVLRIKYELDRDFGVYEKSRKPARRGARKEAAA